MTTAPANFTLRSALATCNPSNIADALKAVCLDFKETGIKLTASATPVTGQLTRSNPQGLCVGSTVVLTPPAASIRGARVTAGAAAAGARFMTDAGGTPAATIATLSDDGTTITFEAGVTGAVISYIPRLTDAELAALFYPVT